MAKFVSDQHFKHFSEALQQVILGYGSDDEDFTLKQKRQVENLIGLEKKFKKTLLEHSKGEYIYKKFIEFIWHSGKDNKRNTLFARPFFRERQSIFSKGISPAIQKRRHKSLYKFNINFPFIAFVLKAYDWGEKSKVTKAAKEVFKARKLLVELNMPLAISRARIFRQKTPESHLSYMDLVQISMEGLINAVDKFVLPYTPVFRSVIIGRVTGDLIESFSDTMVKFWPTDKRKIYRANKTQLDEEDADYNKVSEQVNSGIALENPTNPAEIQQLVLASRHYSMDSAASTSLDDGERVTLADNYADEEGCRPDIQVEQKDSHNKLHNAIGCLSILEQKFLKLKGIEYDN